MIVVVMGVSGSGKSSLLVDTLLPLARAELNRAKIDAVPARIEGLSALDKVTRRDPVFKPVAAGLSRAQSRDPRKKRRRGRR